MNQRLYAYPFADIYSLYVAKVERKRRTLEAFFAKAPAITKRAELITGVVCGIRVEEIEDPLTQQIRWMDKLVDELARGNKLASMLR